MAFLYLCIYKIPCSVVGGRVIGFSLAVFAVMAEAGAGAYG